MIKSFADRETAALFANQRVRRFNSDWLPVARRKLAQLHHVANLDELRICFEWRDGHAWNVTIVDYH